MGNCGSTVDCDKCYSRRKIDGCNTNINVNPDIAGIGVLISFFISAVSICLSIIWYYLRESLPSELLTPTDHYVLRLLKKRHLQFDDSDIDFEISKDQKRRSRTATGYLKVLGAQQLITGFAIIIAGLASRCKITFYEFNIVTSLAYLAAFTHLCSLHVIREYMYYHTTARTWHVIFTVVFFILLCFVYIINTSFYDLDRTISRDYLNPGNALQCFFEANRLGKTINLDIYDSITIGGSIVISHIRIIGNLYIHPSSDFTTMIVYQLMAGSLRDSGLPKEECKEIVYDSEVKYWAWLRPPRDGIPHPRMSIWYIIETFHNSELSFIPTMLGFFGYGTTKIVFAVWYGGLKPSDELRILGFGQVAALGLLALTFISVTEIHDEQKVLDKHKEKPAALPSTHTSEETTMEAETPQDTDDTNEPSSTIQEETTTEACNIAAPSTGIDNNAIPTSPNNAFKPPHPERSHRMLERLVRLWVPKTTHDLEQIKQNPHQEYLDHPFVASRTALYSSILFALHLGLLLFIGVGWNFEETGYLPLLAWLLFIFYRILKTIKRIMNQMYFVHEEVHARRASSRSSTAPSVYRGNSAAGSRISLATARSLPVEFERRAAALARQGTEADVGIVPPTRRQTYPREHE